MEFPVIESKKGGLLLPIEFNSIPFTPQRQFFIFDVKPHHRRGNHGHPHCEELINPIKGSCKVRLNKKDVYVLDNPAVGLYIPVNHFIEMYDFSEDCILSVLARLSSSDTVSISYEDCIKNLKENK